MEKNINKLNNEDEADKNSRRRNDSAEAASDVAGGSSCIGLYEAAAPIINRNTYQILLYGQLHLFFAQGACGLPGVHDVVLVRTWSRVQAPEKGEQGGNHRTGQVANNAIAELQRIEGELARIKESDQADKVAGEATQIVTRLETLGKELKVRGFTALLMTHAQLVLGLFECTDLWRPQITVIEDEGQQIELPENEDEKKLFTKLKAEGYAHSFTLMSVGETTLEPT